MTDQWAAIQDSDVAGVINPDGKHPIVLICEHASNHVPDGFDNLGLGSAELSSHIAWDPGAFLIAELLSNMLDARLVYSKISRLVYDCNRPPDAAGAMPVKSENIKIPGNAYIDAEWRRKRTEVFYRPFEKLISDTLNTHDGDPILVTIHSFTPEFLGEPRDVEIGILHDKDTRLADALLSVADGYVIERNAPYGPEDGVTHTLKHHGLSRHLLNVMIEVRNDLLKTSEQRAEIAEKLCGWLSASVSKLTNAPLREVSNS